MKIGKFEINKEILKVSLYTLFIFCALILTNCPKSYPKYIDKDLNALAYNTELYTLYKGETYLEIIKDGSSDTLAHFRFNFNRNDVVNDASIDKYTIYLPNNSGCYFAQSGIKPAAGGILNGNSITYRSTAKGDNNIVEFYCPISFDENTNILNRLMGTIEEQITVNISYPNLSGLESPFIYKKFVTPEITRERYYEIIDYVEPTPPEPDVVKDKEHLEVPDNKTVDEINKEFDDWIKEIDETLAGEIAPLEEKTITDYVDNYCKNENDEYTDVTKCNIPGMDIDHKDGKYIFTLEDNFVGYARTYNGKVLFDSRLLYFTTKDETEIKTAITYYLNNYYETENASDILNYIESNGGIDALINGRIPGLILYVNNDENIIIKISDNIMGYVFPKSPERPYKIMFDTKRQMEKDFFENNYILNYYGDIVSKEAQDIIIGTSDGEPYYSSVTKNFVRDGISENKSFTDYFVSYDPTNEYYLLIKIYSDVEKYAENTFNTVDFTTLKVPNSDFKISFVNDKTDDTLLKISLSYTDADVITEVIDYLDQYFGVTTNINVKEIAPDATNNINVTYNVIKNIIR